MENSQELNLNSTKKEINSKRRKTIIFVTVFAMIVIVIATILILYFLNKKEDKKENGTSNITKQEVTSPYRMAGNTLENFDLSFLKLENDKKNKVYSPISIKYALEMLAEGASGDTKNEIEAVIGDYKSNKYVNSSNMSFANALFIKDDYQDNIKKDYIDLITNKYNAEVIFDSFATPNNLNNWISNKTFHLINDLFDNVSDKKFVLTNALAIDMEWKNRIQSKYEDHNSYSVNYLHEKYAHSISPIDIVGYHALDFDTNQKVNSVELGASLNNYDIVNILGRDNIKSTITREYTEYVNSGNTCEENPDKSEEAINKYVDNFIEELDSNYLSVAKSTDFKLYTDDNVKVFAKDLKNYNGTTLQYVGIMPINDSLDNYIQNATPDTINSLISNLKDINANNFASGKITKITGYIPMFNFDYELNLKQDLEKLGIKNVFDSSKANLSNLTNEANTYISDVSHKANIDFSNDGIKAAAVTALGGLGDAACGFDHVYEVPIEVIDITFNKPYMFLIRDTSTGEIWFAGTVYEPNSN